MWHVMMIWLKITHVLLYYAQAQIILYSYDGSTFIQIIIPDWWWVTFDWKWLEGIHKKSRINTNKLFTNTFFLCQLDFELFSEIQSISAKFSFSDIECLCVKALSLYVVDRKSLRFEVMWRTYDSHDGQRKHKKYVKKLKLGRKRNTARRENVKSRIK